MNHIDKYVCTVIPNLLFKGDETPTMGTRFHCKACDQHAFQIRGEPHGEAVRNNLKKRHAEHAQRCQPRAERTSNGTPSTDEEDDGGTTAVDLEPSAIATWHARDVQNWMVVHRALPAPVKTYDFVGDWDEDKEYMSTGAGKAAVVFENGFGQSQPLHVSLASLGVGTQRLHQLSDEWAVFRYQQIVNAKVKSLVKRAMRNVLDNARCGHKQSLYNRVEALFRDDPAALERALEAVEKQHRARRQRGSPSEKTGNNQQKPLFASSRKLPRLRLLP